MSDHVIKVCLVQPVQSPYWSGRLKALACHARLELTLLLERDAFAHRPGWQAEPIEGVHTHVLGSTVTSTVRNGDDLGYRIHGIRSIPWRLTAALSKINPDVVVLCNATQLIFALPLKYLLRQRLVLIVEDTPHATRNLGWLPRWIKSFLYRRVDKFFAFSSDAEQFLASIGVVKRVERSSWSLDMELFYPNRNRVDNDLPHSALRRTVIFVGALVNNKGVKCLLDAWRALPLSRRGESQLLLVGSGPMRQEIEVFIHEHALLEVKVLGQVPYLDVRDLLQQSDLLVLPTLQDLFSLTVLESMACGCPVVTTPFNGACELVEHGKNGWVVDPTQPGALAAVLEQALSDKTDLRSMGVAARLRVENMDNTLVMARFAESVVDLAAGDPR